MTSNGKLGSHQPGPSLPFTKACAIAVAAAAVLYATYVSATFSVPCARYSAWRLSLSVVS